MTEILTAIETATVGIDSLHDINAVPKKPEYPYGFYFGSLGRGDSYLLVGEGIRHGRVVVQTFGKSSRSAFVLAEEVRSALVGVRLAIDGYETTPCRAELDPSTVRDPDDSGVIGTTATYTFTATRRSAS